MLIKKDEEPFFPVSKARRSLFFVRLSDLVSAGPFPKGKFFRITDRARSLPLGGAALSL